MNPEKAAREKIDALSERELLHEINLGPKSRFQGNKFAYVETRYQSLKGQQEQTSRDDQVKAMRDANYIAKRGWLIQIGIAVLGAIAAGAASWFLNNFADEKRDRERFVERREALLQKIVANDNYMKLLRFQGTWLLREMRDAEQENLFWDNEKVESARMMRALQVFLEESLPKLLVRPHSASEIGTWTRSPENEQRLQGADRFESRYAGMAELRAFEINLKTGDEIVAVIDKRRQVRLHQRPPAPSVPASAAR